MNKVILFLTVLFWSFLNAQTKKEITFKEAPAILKINTNEIHGTLTTPDLKKYPVALIIAGSGPTNRDGNNAMMKNNSLKMLAESLAKNGIASLRYDKRGIGESKAAGGASESALVFENYIDDAKSWINYLKQDKRFSKIIVIGHSEGSLIGMISAAKANKFISIAGAGEPADQLIKKQIGARSMKQLEDMTYPIIDSLKNGFAVKKVDPMLNSLFRPSIQPYLISWFKYDPQAEIKKLVLPILILQGNEDLQVSVKDAENLSQANKNAEMVIIDKMNHIMKIIDGDKNANIASYSNDNLPISEILIEKIVSFIEK